MNTSSVSIDTLPRTAGGAVARRTGRAWLVTIMLLAFMLINFADKAVLGLAAKPIMHDLGLSPSEYGLLSSSFYFLFSVSAIVVGFLSNRVPTKWLLLGMAVIWALTQAPVLGNIGFGGLLATRVILGAAEGPANPVAMHAAHKWFPNEKRSLPSALLNAGSGIGVALAAPLLTAVIVDYGWRWAFFVLFLVGMVWALLWALLGREGSVPSTASVHAPRAADVDAEPRVPYRRLLLSGTWLGGFVAGFAAYWALALLTAWIPPYLETALHYSAVTTGSLVVLPWVAAVIFILVQGLVTQSLMQRGVSSRMARGLLGGGAVVVAGVAMVLFALVSGGPAKIALMTVAFGLGGVIFAIGVTVTAEISPTKQRGAALAISVGLTTTAGILAPDVTGRIIEASPGATGYTTAFVVAGVLMLVGGLLAAIFVRPERDARRLGLRPAVQEPVAA